MLRRQSDFPKEFVIKDGVWKVKFVRHFPNEPANTVGLCDPSTQTISIKQGQKPRERLVTFLHETGHAFEFEYNINILHSLIEKWANIFADLILENT